MFYLAVSGRNLIFQLVLAGLPYTQVCTYNNDTIITFQKKNYIIDFVQSFKKKVDKTGKCKRLGIKIEHCKHYKMTKDRLK